VNTNLVLSLIAAVYAWQVHGIWIGFLVFSVMGAAYVALNTMVIHRIATAVEGQDGSSDFFRPFKVVRWAVFMVAMIAIGLSGASIGSVR
jgi:hypothetical protein